MSLALIIGSRGSQLALWQAERVKDLLLARNPLIEVRIEIIKTTGDVKSEPLTVIGGKGVFTKELEDALLDGRIDVAVHSLKDLPTLLPPDLTISAICKREDPRDALVLRADSDDGDASLMTLPRHSVVGTSSQRRAAQLRALRPDVEIKDLRGNVDTRLRKLDEGQYQSVILASAGLRRLGLESRISASIPTSEMLPAVGQGALAIETRKHDDATCRIVRELNHAETNLCCIAERALLRQLGGGCQLPIAAHATLEHQLLKLEGLVAAPDGSQIVRDQISGAFEQAEQLGAELANKLITNGADKLLERL
ncbi:MAG TPA: hydroxymethylbilane synthase [Pyrinomonadaceae bacterium]|nr:hydroxymethylbilane synthase [Pyrinomonadaceae bacterium]